MASTASAGKRRGERLEKFLADPLARQGLDAPGLGGTGRPARRIARRDAEARGEAVEAQDAQMVFPDALVRIADEADAGRVEIGEAAEIVEHRAVRAQGQRVDRESRGAAHPRASRR